MKQVGFRARLFLFLIGFALIPTILLSAAWELTVVRLLPILGTIPAMEHIASSGTTALAAARRAPLNATQRQALDDHQTTLEDGLLHARQMEFLMTRKVPVLAASVALVAGLLFTLVASRVADHLSRNLSRPIDELVGWTATIGRGESLPDVPPRKGAPEFVMLRNRMREMSAELRRGRTRALETERAMALRESARQVAHELKNPLTPIRFAITRLRRDAPASLSETIDVLEVESKRLEVMARSFAQFGRLPDGPRAPVDLAEMVRVVARSAVPAERPLSIDVADDIPMVSGHVEALGRALTNVLLNAVDASSPASAIELCVTRVTREGRPMVEVAVRDFGAGIPASRLDSIWEPYVTHKPGGTGLGLAIVRQTLLAHEGAVEATSTPGEGTTMRLFLPADTPMADARGTDV
ncbi:MAG: HAMP domain-containing histidine kinase [Gemmatimonadota bacterium]|nr:HAMP domain-containing histidine kinase [Gemmatimonadota bacterium]